MLTNVIQVSYNQNMIIFDASTLILLAKIDMLELFTSIYVGEILIPDEVKKEVCVKNTVEGLKVKELLRSERIKVKALTNHDITKSLTKDFNLDLGEAEAINLALQEHASLIATDDRNAIMACRLLNLSFTTAISFLIRAAETHLLKKEEALLKLQKLQLVGRYKKRIIEDAINRIEEIQ